ncbi:MAG: SHOCT domain-containing protein [Oscillospiraceae bacterium]|nr:SHOCT domain-containing protein [Oscillospiraceae bacterium]
MSESNTNKELALESVITSAIQIPGVKVNRNKFLAELFATEDVAIQEVLDHGPISAGISQERISAIANKHILKRTSQSSVASFAAGIPGGLAMAATIPADVMQFFGMALRLAQELSYLYGAEDLWQGGQVDDEKVQNQLLLYCGVMFGVSGAVSGVRVLSTQIAKTTLKKLPQKALTKTFWYPMIKQIGKAVGIKVTKSTVAKGVSKAAPILGGVISGGLNFASMMPMAHRLMDALDSAFFGYTQEEFEKDIIEIENFAGQETDIVPESKNTKEKLVESGKKAKENMSDFFSRKKQKDTPKEAETPIELIKKLAELRDAGIISDEEFELKKAELLSKI